jgi:hypothetical protein
MDSRQHAVAAVNGLRNNGNRVDDDRGHAIEVIEQEITLAVRSERERCAKIVRECDYGGPGGDPQCCNCMALLKKVEDIGA